LDITFGGYFMRYDLGFNLKVIAYYRKRRTGVSTAKKFGLDEKTVPKWIQQYQIGGIVVVN